MQPNERQFRNPWTPGALQAPSGNGLLGRVMTAVASIVVLTVAFILSFVIFAVVAGVALIVAAYIWWRTRALRRNLREHARGGRIIEGQVIPDDPVRRID